MDTTSSALDWGAILSNAGGGGLGALVLYMLVSRKLLLPRESDEKDKQIQELKDRLKESADRAESAIIKLDAAHTKEVQQLAATLLALRGQMDRVIERSARDDPKTGAS